VSAAAPLYTVVVNHEEQYSIWPADQPLPRGWTPGAIQGPLDVCLSWIRETWSDRRLRSLRANNDAATPVRAVSARPC
jgi:MbtH protein